MVKKLIISACLVLFMAVMAPAQPAHIPFRNLDIDGGYGPTQQDYPTGWPAWYSMPYGQYGPKFGTITKNMAGVTVSITVMTYASGNNGDGRDRGRPDGGNDVYLSNVYRDFVYVPHTTATPAHGGDWLQVDISGLTPDANYEITVFNYDNNHGWASQPHEDCNDKFMVWGVDNPGDYGLNQPGEEPCAPYKIQVPCAGPYPNDPNLDDPWAYSGSFEATAGRTGTVTFYGWFNAGTWSGTEHGVINGLAISAPEPATVALLGLGGLALVRRKKR